MTSQLTNTSDHSIDSQQQADQDMSFLEEMPPVGFDADNQGAAPAPSSTESASAAAAAAAAEEAAAAAAAAAAEAAAAAAAAAQNGTPATQAASPKHAAPSAETKPSPAADSSEAATQQYGFELSAADLVQPTDDLPETASTGTHATEPGVKRVRKKRRSHRKRRRIIRRILIVVIILAIIVAGVAIAYTTLNAKGEQQLKQAAQSVDYNEGATVEYNGQKYAYNTNIVSLCFMGYDLNSTQDDGSTNAQADAIMVLAMDTETGQLTVINIPRDSMVEVDAVVNSSLNSTKTMQICLAFGMTDDEESGAENVCRSVQRVLNNMPITYYFAMNESAVVPLNDAIGGVTLTALQTIPNTSIVQGNETTLLGSDSLKYVQWRDTSVFASSLDRQERQMQYVKTFAHQALQKATSVGGISTLTDLFSTAQEYSNTNLGLSEFTYLATTVLNKGITDINMVTLEGTMTQGSYYNEYNLDSDKTYQTVLDVFYKPVSSDSENNQA